MKKRWMMLLVTLICAMSVLMACSQSDTTTKPIETAEKESSEMAEKAEETESSESLEAAETEAAETETAGVGVTIFYSNDMADGLEKEQLMMESLTAENLIKALGSHNIVSIDTKVKSFEVLKDGKLSLDLNRPFGEYLMTMGTSGEYIILASLTNTFLENYKAEQIAITVEGKAIETGHNEYDEPFTYYYFETDQGNAEQRESISYRLADKKLVINGKENADIVYPQLTEMENVSVQNTLNKYVAEYVSSMYGAEGLKFSQCTYEQYFRDNVLSIVIRGTTYAENAAYSVANIASFNMNLEDGKLLQLKDYGNIREIASRIYNYDNCRILNMDMDEQQLQQILEEYYPELELMLEQYDLGTDFGLLSWTPGYSYQNADGIVVVLPVQHALGDYIEVELYKS